MFAKIFSRLTLMTALLTSITSLAKRKERFEGNVSAKNNIEIDSYDRKSNTYHIVRPDMPFTKTGWLYATQEDLADAVESLKLTTLRERPESIVGTVFTTDKDLFLVMPGEIRTNPKFSEVYKWLKKQDTTEHH